MVVVNTCGFIDAAKEESVQTILEAAELKTSGRCRRLVVAGCLVQRAHEELRREIPEIDAFAGLDDIPGILGHRRPRARGRGGPRPFPRSPEPPAPPSCRSPPRLRPAPSTAGRLWLYDDESPRVLSGPAHSAYLKIAEGCDNPCSFCAIPAFRGAFRSRRLGSILREAQGLAAQGVRELNLIAQDSTHYGHDLGLADGPARLLRGLNEIEELRWIRLFYVYPNRVTDSLLDAMAECERVVKYLDMPLQSASRTVLARMKRGGSGESHLRLIERMRERVPGLVLRSTFIAGFPGETEAEFRETLEFLEAAAFDHAGVFTYSHEEQTPAFALVDDVPHEVKAARREQLLAAQEKIARAKNRARVGTTIEVLCEGAHPESDDLLVGRHRGQAPEIDGSVILNEGDAAPGEFVRAKVVRAHPFDLVARVLGPAEAPRSMAPGTR